MRCSFSSAQGDMSSAAELLPEEIFDESALVQHTLVSHQLQPNWHFFLLLQGIPLKPNERTLKVKAGK